MKAQSTAQIPLPLTNYQDRNFELFEPGPNREAIDCLRGLARQPEANTVIYLWGGHSTGKTHLLHALCNAIAGNGGRPVYVALSQANELSPTLLDGLEAMDIVCIDDIHLIGADADWELALFHLYQ